MITVDTTTYEIRVRYDNGDHARFVEPDFVTAMEKAGDLQKLVTVDQVHVNEVVIKNLYTWSRS